MDDTREDIDSNRWESIFLNLFSKGGFDMAGGRFGEKSQRRYTENLKKKWSYW